MGYTPVSKRKKEPDKKVETPSVPQRETNIDPILAKRLREAGREDTLRELEREESKTGVVSKLRLPTKQDFRETKSDIKEAFSEERKPITDVAQIGAKERADISQKDEGVDPTLAKRLRESGQKERLKKLEKEESRAGVLPQIPSVFTDTEDIRKSVGEGFRSGVLQTGSALETIASIGAEKIGADQISERLEKAAKKDKELARVGIDVEDERKFSEKIQDPEYIAKGFAQNLPNLLFGLGVGLPAAAVGAPAAAIAGSAFLGASSLEAGFAYQDAKEFGADDETAEKSAALVGVANGLLEVIPITSFLKRIPSGRQIKKRIIEEITKRVVKQSAQEAGTESLQEIISNSVATVYDENRDILSGVPESAFFGGLIGGGLGLAGSFVPGQIEGEARPGFARLPELPGKKDADAKRGSETAPSERVSRKDIERQIRPEARTVERKEDVLLRERLRAEKRGAKIGAKEARKETRQEERARSKESLEKRTQELKEKRRSDISAVTSRMSEAFDRRISELKRSQELGELKGRIKQREVERVKKELVDFVNQNLKQRERGRQEILSKIKNARSVRDIERAKPRVIEIAEQAEVRDVKSSIRKELKDTRPKKQAGKPKGRFTADVQNVLDKVRDASKLSQKEAQEKLENNLERFKDETPPPEVALENRILSMSSKNSDTLKELLSDVRSIKETGRVTSELRQFNIQTDIDRTRDIVVEKVTGGKGIQDEVLIAAENKKTRKEKLKQRLKTLGKSWILDWQGLLSVMSFNTKAGDTTLNRELSVGKQENEYKRLQSDYAVEFNEMMSDVYGIPNKRTAIQKKIIENNQEVDLGEFTWADGKKRPLVLTKDEMIKRWMEFQDPTLEESFEQGNRYTEDIRDAIRNELTEQDIELGRRQLEMYRRQYDRVNAKFRIINGVDLPFNEFYSPIRRRGFQVDTEKGFGEFIEEATYRRAVTNKSLISRVKNLNPIEKQGSLNALDRHFTETNYYIAWVDKIRKLDATFKDANVRESIKQEFGKDFLASVENVLNDLSTNGNRTARRFAAADWVRKKFTVGSLMIKPAIAAKQLVSTVAYMEELSPSEFLAGVADFAKNPVKAARTLSEESTFVRTRGENIERDIKAAIETDVYKKFSTSQNFINTLMMNVRIGDKGAILMGSWAMRRKLLKDGMSKEDAVKRYEEFGQQTQQSSDVSRLSQVQRGSSLEKLVTMFKSSPRQYFQKELNAVRSLFQDGGTSKENLRKVAKTLFIYHTALPLTFQFIANLGGWDEEDRKEYLRAALLGSINGIFIFGDIVDAVLRGALGMRVWNLEMPVSTIYRDIIGLIDSIDIDDISNSDFKEAIDSLAGAGSTLGIPTEQALSITKGIGDVIEGNVSHGLGLILGWSEYYLDSKGSKGSTGGGAVQFDLPPLPNVEAGTSTDLPKLPELPKI